MVEVVDPGVERTTVAPANVFDVSQGVEAGCCGCGSRDEVMFW